ncbi:MAG: hypothetical protein CK526_00675 [Thaumarchaeota archaeon]|nr:hypothetical protein [Nitrosopumilus sp.]PHY04804.1 MAG: hypothetical protein CK526_00675 [Nitrososphaerota archaeon]
MTKVRSVLLIFIILFSSISAINPVHAHSLFNSAEEFYGGYRVQVATTPEFPQIDEPSQFLIRVTDTDFNEVDSFTMGIRVFYNDQQVNAIPPTTIKTGHWDIDYIWKYQGNHIVLIDLYDMDGTQGTLTYSFNMGTQSPFGIIFILAITIGALTFAVIMGYIYLPKIFKKSKS